LLVLWERLKLGLSLSGLLILLFSGAILSQRLGVTYQSIVALINDPARAGVIGTLLGAVVGGIIAFYGSVYVQKAQLAAQAAIRRRDEVYIPLYDELQAMKANLEEHPCPWEIVTRINQDSHYSPKFAVWGSLKKTSIGLRVPNRLAQELEIFAVAITQFLASRQEALQDKEVEAKIKEIIVGTFGQEHASRLDLASHFLPCTPDLEYTRRLLVETASFDTAVNKRDAPVSDQQINRAAMLLHRESIQFDCVRKVMSDRQKLEDQLNDLILSLEKVIKYINMRFAQHETWF
jgi:hypothetical protein